MALTLYYHPLSSFCWKALIALYEADIAFEPRVVNLGDPADRAAFQAVWPLGKFPVLRDETRGVTVPESSVIIEYLDLHYPGPTRLVPADPDAAWRCRLLDRFYDLHVNEPMSRIVADRQRPAARRDPDGVARARRALRTAYDFIEPQMETKTWAMGDTFSMADCAAAPALFYADKVLSFHETHPRTAAYFGRLRERPSFARVLVEAEPYLHLFPKEE